MSDRYPEYQRPTHADSKMILCSHKTYVSPGENMGGSY